MRSIKQQIQQRRAVRARTKEAAAEFIIRQIQQRAAGLRAAVQFRNLRNVRQQRIREAQLLQHGHASRLQHEARAHRQLLRRAFKQRDPMPCLGEIDRRCGPGSAGPHDGDAQGRL